MTLPPAGESRPRVDPRSFTVRTARSTDLPAIAALEREAFSDPWSLRSFTGLLASSAVWFAVAVTAGVEREDVERSASEATGIAGFVIALQAGDEGEIANIAVRVDRRGQGIGSLLLDAALAQLGTAGVGDIFLEVRESNLEARQLYQRRGFIEVGRRRRYYRSPTEDALVLKRASVAGRAGADPSPAGDVSAGA